MGGLKRPGMTLTCSRGFTLIELLVVVTIMAITIGTIVPMMTKSLGNYEVRGAAKQISTTMRYCRNRAVSAKMTFGVIVDRDKKTFAMARGDSLFLKKSIPGDVEIENMEFVDDSFYTKDKGVFLFYPRGNSNGGKLVLGKENTHYQILVDPLTGSTKVKRL
jgi:general secretion pathway protein H